MMMTNKKFKISSEAAYALAIITMAFAVSLCSASDMGLSMIAAPAFILSEKIGPLSFGQCEYIVQGALFVLFCLLMKKVRLIYFFSFLTGVIYGAVLDLMRKFIPFLNPEKMPPAETAFPLRLFFFAFGTVICALSVALFYVTYLYPMVYDFFAKYISIHFKVDRVLFKRLFDAGMLVLSLTLTLVFFRGFVGVGWGTIVTTIINGPIIGLFIKILEKKCEIKPSFNKLKDFFEGREEENG